jgi:hypothetical protein
MYSRFRRLTVGLINTICLRLFDYHITVSDRFRRMLIGRGFSSAGMMTIYNGLIFPAVPMPGTGPNTSGGWGWTIPPVMW